MRILCTPAARCKTALRRIAGTVVESRKRNPHILQYFHRFFKSHLIRLHQMRPSKHRIHRLSETLPHTLNHI